MGLDRGVDSGQSNYMIMNTVNSMCIVITDIFIGTIFQYLQAIILQA